MSYDSNEEINAKENLGSNVNEDEKIIPINSNSQSLINENFRGSENKSLVIKASSKSENESGKSSDEVKNSVKNKDEGEKRKEREKEEKGKEYKNDKKNTQIENKKSNELDLTSALLRMEEDVEFLSNIISEKGNDFIKELKNTKEGLINELKNTKEGLTKELKNTKEDVTKELKKNNENLNNINENLKKIAEILSEKKISN